MSFYFSKSEMSELTEKDMNETTKSDNQIWENDYSVEDEYFGSFLEIRMVHTPVFNIVYCKLHNENIIVTPSMLAEIELPELERPDLLTVISAVTSPLLQAFLCANYSKNQGIAIHNPNGFTAMIKSHPAKYLKVGDTIDSELEHEEINSAMIFASEFIYS